MRLARVLSDEDATHLWGSGLTHLAVNEAPLRLRTFKSLPGAPDDGPCTRVQPCLASTVGGERYSDGPPPDGRELEWQSFGLLLRGSGFKSLAANHLPRTEARAPDGSLCSVGLSRGSDGWRSGVAIDGRRDHFDRRHDVKASIAHCR